MDAKAVTDAMGPSLTMTMPPGSATKGEVIAGGLVLAGVLGLSGLFVYLAVKDDQRIRQEALEQRRKRQEETDRKEKRLEDERHKAQEAAAKGHTVLPNTDGTYWIIEKS